MSMRADGARADVFDLPPPPPKHYMELPPPGSYRRGPKHEPLINIPPPEDPLLSFLSSMIMKHGERAKARRRVAQTLLHIHAFTRAPPMPILREAVLLSSPAVRVRSKTVGARVVHTPFALTEKQRTRSGIEWLLEASKSRPGRTLEERLARQMIDVLQRTFTARGEDKPDYAGVLQIKQKAHEFAMVNRGTVRVDPAEQRAFSANQGDS
ncbi:ribosomal protein S7 [Roridomyces roridus]|uniref:Ribosomal protein S7 n=1 Tax=Roridomyces roridus TaxID=1738132 RepID=A0AAD7C3K2_9AGAR|nr:ribosomal protein S7 [Roridomyces roridus]